MASLATEHAMTCIWKYRVLPLLLLFTLHSGIVQAQVRIPAAALAGQHAIDQLLADGGKLEAERRWGDALIHYEDALREHPGRHELETRLRVSRAHYDIARRYNDPSFTASLGKISEKEALDLYGELLFKLQTHYVHNPDWQRMVDQGLLNLDVAFEEPGFIEKNLSRFDQNQRIALRRNLPRVSAGKVALNRNDVRSMVAATARYAGQNGFSPQAVVYEFACGATAALDEYSSFLTGDQLDEVFSQIEGNFVGLGIEIKADAGSLLIVNVISGSPAEEAGMQSGDRMIGIAGEPINERNADAAADRLKGPEGSTIDVRVASPNGIIRNLRVARRRVEVPSVDKVEIVDSDFGIGYLRITSFQKTTNRDLDAALWKLHRLGMRSLIMDLRGNPGGLLTASVEVADKFVSEGTIVSTRGRSAREDFDYKAHGLGTWRVPLVVLIDGDSASASEIFAGAISDHRRGTVVGQRSYGKGSVQGIFPLTPFSGGVRLTTAKFYSPNGTAISKRGVSPHISVQTAAKPTEAGQLAEATDRVLDAGKQVARQQLSQR